MIHDYPKTSCKCYNFTKTSNLANNTTSSLANNTPSSLANNTTSSLANNTPSNLPNNTPSNLPNNTPSNLAINNCQIPELLNFYNIQNFNQTIEPINNSGYIILNSKALSDKFSNNFQELDFPKSKGTKKYVSCDPRLISPIHNQILKLDRPPIESKMQLSDIPRDKSLNNYGQNYTSYHDINAGNIVYYKNKELENAYHGPNFTNSSHITGYVYKDPMDSLKPIYQRKPVKMSDHLNTKKDKYDGGLSWIQDSNEHREDLISHQMSKRLQQKWESRW